MDAARWQRIKALFESVVDLPADARERELAAACADDDALRREVEDLLAADAFGDTFDHRASDLREEAASDWAEWNAPLDGVQIGAWRVQRELGRGGMGLVLLVARADGQFEQQAALKLIKRGMDSEAVLARFRRERQILARLEHRNIARLLDGGIAPDGRPYLVMEYVDGVPLSQYCSENASDLEERLRLFFGTCAAVQFAHRQLVVHSDLKPSNVLVSSAGDVKLLDFGIAKLLVADDSGAPTLNRDRPLTPAYAAPEQLRGEPVTTATDVYALGCLLYEMLTGQRPFSRSESLTLDEINRALEATGPVAPSQLRNADAPIAPRRLRGDLDTIVLKALKREPDRRYATVDAFAEDLKRFLAGRPIAAHRDSGWYRARKFVARHRTAVFASVLGVVVLGAAIGVALWQARQKAAQAQAAQEVAHFLVGLFAASDPTRTRGAAVTAQDLLDQGAARLHSALGDQPSLRARLLQTVATSYTALGLYDRALPLTEQALALRREPGAPPDADVAESMDALGQIYLLKADYDRAEPLLRDALAIRRGLPGDDGRAVIESLGHVGQLLQDRGDFQAADVPFREANERAEKQFGSDSLDAAKCMHAYATNLQNMGKTVEAESLYRKALAIREHLLSADDPDVAVSLHDLGENLAAAGSYREAQQILGRALEIRQHVYGPSHPLVGYTKLALGIVYESTNNLAAAEPLAEQALAIFRESLDADHRKITESLNLLAILRLDRRDYATAAELFRDVLARSDKSLGADHPDTLAAELNLGFTLYYAGEMAEAERVQRDLLAKLRSDDGTGNDVMNLRNLARTLEQQGRAKEAVPIAQRSLDLQRGYSGERSQPYAFALRELAHAERLNGDAQAAETHFRESMKLAGQLAPGGGFGAYGWTIPYADFLVAASRCEEAMPLLQAAVKELTASSNALPIWRPQADLLICACQRKASPSTELRERMSAARAQLRTLPAIELDLYPEARRLYTEP